MAPRPLLGRIFLALLLLAGWAVFAGLPDRAQAAVTEFGLAQHHVGNIQARLHHDRGQAVAVVLDPTWGDTDDDDKAFPRARTNVALAPYGKAQGFIAPRRPSPLSHWPCAGTPTGPPHR
jgi:hypothetical protein